MALADEAERRPMQRVCVILRVFAFTGCLLVLARSPRLPVVRAYACGTFNLNGVQYDCPAGCTSPKYTTYPYQGSGTYAASPNNAPCTPATDPKTPKPELLSLNFRSRLGL